MDSHRARAAAWRTLVASASGAIPFEQHHFRRSDQNVVFLTGDVARHSLLAVGVCRHVAGTHVVGPVTDAGGNHHLGHDSSAIDVGQGVRAGIVDRRVPERCCVGLLPSRERSRCCLAGAVRICLEYWRSVLDLRHSWPVWILLQPFQLFSSVILADAGLFFAVGKLFVAAATIGSTVWMLVRLDAHVLWRRKLREIARFKALPSPAEAVPSVSQGPAVPPTVRIPARVQGAYALFWRQLRGMYHYRHTLALSFVAPGLLSLLPLFGDADPYNMLMQILGSLVFYSLVLLPSALRFDFRRDVERMAVIKSFPISPAWITLGQLAGPIVLCTWFQIVVLLIAMVVRPYHPAMFLIAITILLPVNALIFCVENLMFMLFPYRLNQEGIGVFLRSILTFTAKGILFLVALVTTLGVAGASASIAHRITLGDYGTRLITVFTLSIWFLLIGILAVAFGLLTKVVHRFDPSQDTPATS